MPSKELPVSHLLLLRTKCEIKSVESPEPGAWVMAVAFIRLRAHESLHWHPHPHPRHSQVGVKLRFEPRPAASSLTFHGPWLQISQSWQGRGPSWVPLSSCKPRDVPPRPQAPTPDGTPAHLPSPAELTMGCGQSRPACELAPSWPW